MVTIFRDSGLNCLSSSHLVPNCLLVLIFHDCESQKNRLQSGLYIPFGLTTLFCCSLLQMTRIAHYIINHVSVLQILVWGMQREVQCRGCWVSVPDQCFGVRQNTDGTDHSVWCLSGQVLWHISHKLCEVWLQNVWVLIVISNYFLFNILIQIKC